MTQFASARHGYAAGNAPVRSQKTIEYDLVARITRRIKTAAAEGPAGFTRLVAALHDNKRLWTIFAADVADPENGLPQALRAQLFYLAEFTNVHTSAVLARRADPGPLIDINTAILKGLRGEAGA